MLSVRRIPNPWEVDDLFRRSFQELGLPHPAPEDCLSQHARDVAERIVSGTLDPLEGAHILNTVAEALDRSEDLAPWTGFDEDLFLVLGADGRTLYYSEDDMISYIERKAQSLVQEIPKRYF